MKIELEYREPGTEIKGYIFRTIYDETEYKEALEEYYGAQRAGYEITTWRLLHDEDVKY